MGTAVKGLNEWKDNVESKGMRVNMNKTKVKISGEGHDMLCVDGDADAAVEARIRIG